MQIETLRLLLRPMREQDTAQVYAWCSEPEVGPPAGWRPHTSPEETRRLLRESFLGRDWAFAIVWRKTGQVIGSIALRPEERRHNPRARSVGYALSSEFWGQGLMHEALEALCRAAFASGETDLLSACCYPFNTRSQAVLEACGFRREGVLRRCERRFDGLLLDWVCYSLLREEMK